MTPQERIETMHKSLSDAQDMGAEAVQMGVTFAKEIVKMVEGGIAFRDKVAHLIDIQSVDEGEILERAALIAAVSGCKKRKPGTVECGPTEQGEPSQERFVVTVDCEHSRGHLMSDAFFDDEGSATMVATDLKTLVDEINELYTMQASMLAYIGAASMFLGQERERSAKAIEGLKIIQAQGVSPDEMHDAIGTLIEELEA